MKRYWLVVLAAVGCHSIDIDPNPKTNTRQPFAASFRESPAAAGEPEKLYPDYQSAAKASEVTPPRPASATKSLSQNLSTSRNW